MSLGQHHFIFTKIEYTLGWTIVVITGVGGVLSSCFFPLGPDAGIFILRYIYHPCYQQLHHVVVKMGSIESLASATCHNQSGRGRAHISEVGPKNGWWEKGGERRHDNGAGDAASPLPTRALFCSAPASTILTPTNQS